MDRLSGDLTPIERRKVYELVAERLLGEIRDQRLRPGEALPTERELATSFRVGRSSVREALRVLESKGVIRSTGSGGFVVATLANPLNNSIDLLLAMEEVDVPELFEVRKIIEVEMAGLAAERRSAEDLAEMEEALEAMEEHLASEQGYIGADVRFHLAVIRASGNRIALRMMEAIRGVLSQAFRSIFHIPGSPQLSTAQHREIYEAIRAGDPAAARARMLAHLVRVERETAELRNRTAAGEGRG